MVGLVVVVVLCALVLVLLLCRVLLGMWVFFSFPVSFPETDGGLLWGNLSPVSFPETAGGLLLGNLPWGLFVAHGRPTA